MFDWLRRWMAGGPPDFPQGAEVERDASGRVTSVSYRAGFPPAESAHPTVDATVDLAEASRWLRAQNVHAARTWGLGAEVDFSYDQADGLLRLVFADGAELALPAQLLGSFDPRDRSFMWGWHNPSFSPALRAAAQKAREEARGDAAFTTPVQTVTFDGLSRRLAWAAQVSGCDGVYRALTNGSTSVFLGYRVPAEARTLPPVDPRFEARAAEVAAQYDREQLAVDRAHHEAPDGELGERVAEKRVSWDRHWARDDDYWHPSSVGWPSDHDRERRTLQFTAPHPAGGVLDIGLEASPRKAVYRLEDVGGAPKITDQLIEWGGGFVWPDDGSRPG